MRHKFNRLLLRNRCGEPKHFQMHSDNRIYFPYFSIWLTQNITSAILLCIAYCLFFGSLFFNTFHRLSPQRLTRYTMRINHHESFLSNYSKPDYGTFSLKLFLGFLEQSTYRKVASSRLSWLVAHLRIFRQFMKGKFDPYVLWPLAKRV